MLATRQAFIILWMNEHLPTAHQRDMLCISRAWQKARQCLVFTGFLADWKNCDLGHLGSLDWQGLFLDFVASSSLGVCGVGNASINFLSIL